MAWAAIGLSVFLLVACLGTLTAEIVLRYAFNYPLQKVSELVTISFIYVYLVGGAALYARNEDIALDYLYRKAGVKPRALWLLLIYATIALTMAVTLWETVKMMILQKHVLTPTLRLPLSVEFAALAVCAALILYASLVEMLGCWLWLRTGQRPKVFPDPVVGDFVHAKEEVS